MNLRKFARALAARRVVNLYLKTASPELLARTFPALSAAFDAYSAVREQQRQEALARQLASYPSLMAEYTRFQSLPLTSDYGQTSSAPTGHHHRHYHRRHHHHVG
jgi:hypothetical protein